MTDKRISLLRQRVTFLRPPKRASRRRVEDMTVRGFTAGTQVGYVCQSWLCSCVERGSENPKSQHRTDLPVTAQSSPHADTNYR